MSRKAIFGWVLAAGLALEAMVFSALFTLANQSNTWSPTTGTVSGLLLTQNYNNAFSAVQSCNSGAGAPSNDQTGFPVAGQCWLNTSTTPQTVSKYDGTAWTTVGWLDTVNHQWIANNAGGSGTLGSAGTTDLGTVQSPVISVTGTATITSFGSSALAGAQKFLSFTGSLTLTHNGLSLILPNGGANILTQAGDTAIAVYLGSGNWQVQSYTRAAGIGAGTITPTFLANSAVPYGTPMLNGVIQSSVAANAMTISIKTLAGATPSAIDPVLFLVPDPTAGFVVIKITSGLSVTIPSGASLGIPSNQPNRVWLAVFNNSGTPVLGVYYSLNGLNVVPWDETSQSAGTAISGSSTASQTWYTASSIGSPVSFRVIGLIESTQSTAGLWASSASKNALFGPGVRKPGEVVQESSTLLNSTGTASSTTFTAVPGATLGYTPISSCNLVRVDAAGPADNGNNNNAQFRLSRGTTAATGLFGTLGSRNSNIASTVTMFGYDVPGGSTTYAVQGASPGASAIFPSVTPGGMSFREIQI